GCGLYEIAWQVESRHRQSGQLHVGRLLRAAVARILRRHRLVGNELRRDELARHEVRCVVAADVQREVRRAAAGSRVGATGRGIGSGGDAAERRNVRSVSVSLPVLVAGLLVELSALLYE